jgi:hypothetical protein
MPGRKHPSENWISAVLGLRVRKKRLASLRFGNGAFKRPANSFPLNPGEALFN